MPRYRVLPHTADIGIVAGGATPEEVFENAAFGMFDLMFDLAAAPAPKVECAVAAAGDGLAETLVAWLSALLAEAEIRDVAFTTFRASLTGTGRVTGVVGGPAAEALELRGPPVKAVTYHELIVVETPEGWEARVIFDV